MVWTPKSRAVSHSSAAERIHRHLKTKLKESERHLHERETEIVELKSLLARMREDWVEEECHRLRPSWHSRKPGRRVNRSHRSLKQ